MAKISYQNYPRITDESNPLHGYLDDQQSFVHTHTISLDQMKQIVRAGIAYAAGKSGRAILHIPDSATEEMIHALLDAFQFSTEETIFGASMEGLAIFINQNVCSDWKSGIEGINFEFDRDVTRYIVTNTEIGKSVIVPWCVGNVL